MGYRIEYDNGTQRFEVSREMPWCPWVLSLVCFGLFVLLSSWFWPEGYAFLQDLLIPGEDAVTIQAFANLADQLKSGTEFQDALATFCREVMFHEMAVH